MGSEAITAAIERVLVGGNHLALLIGADHPPYTATHDAALEHYRQNHDGYEAWCCWRTIMALRDANGKSEPTIPQLQSRITLLECEVSVLSAELRKARLAVVEARQSRKGAVMPSEMRERLAQALQRAIQEQAVWTQEHGETLNVEGHLTMEGLVTAALEELLKPTPAMIRVGGAMVAAQRGKADNVTAMYVWAQMLKAALGEEAGDGK